MIIKDASIEWIWSWLGWPFPIFLLDHKLEYIYNMNEIRLYFRTHLNKI
jgi:hypothetical protein